MTEKNITFSYGDTYNKCIYVYPKILVCHANTEISEFKEGRKNNGGTALTLSSYNGFYDFLPVTFSHVIYLYVTCYL